MKLNGQEMRKLAKHAKSQPLRASDRKPLTSGFLAEERTIISASVVPKRGGTTTSSKATGERSYCKDKEKFARAIVIDYSCP